MSDRFALWVRNWLTGKGAPLVVRKRRALVVKVVEHEWPAIARGERIASDDQSKVERVVQALRDQAREECPRDLLEGERRVGEFAALLDRGHRLGLWQIILPAFPMEIKRQRSPFSPGSVALLDKSRAIEQALLRSLDSVSTASEADRAAQILCSGILLGGLLSWKRVLHLAKLRAKYVRHDSGLVWVDFPIGMDKGNEPDSKALTSDEQTALSRWFPDPVTSLLLLDRIRSNGANADAHLIATEPLKRANLVAQIRSFLTKHGCPDKQLPRSAKDLFDCGAMRLRASAMSCLVAYAKGQIQSVSLTSQAWARARSGLVLNGPATSEKPSNAPVDDVTATSVAATSATKPLDAGVGEKLFDRLLQIVGRLSKKRHVRRKMLAAAIRASIANGPKTLSAIRYLYFWAADLIEGRAVKLSSIHRYLTAFGRKYVRLAGTLDLRRVSEADMIKIYSEVLHGTKRSQAPYVSGCLTQFHRYLVRVYDIADIDFTDVEGVEFDETAVSANVLTPTEFDACSRVLESSGDPGSKSGRRRWIASVSHIIGYRAGLRTSELCELCIGDLRFEGVAELSVCRDSQKTTNARRAIPIGLFLTRREHTILRRWRDQRLAETREDMDAPLLAIDPAAKKPMSENEVRAPVQEVIRRVTGDSSLTFKHLRHSFGNWVLLMLVADEVPRAINDAVKLFDHEGLSTRRRMRLRRHLFPRGNAAGARYHSVRPALYQVAALFGHSSPGVSLRHYLHLMDYLLGREVYEISPRLKVRQAASVLRVHPSRVYQICQGRVEEGRLHPGVLIEYLARRADVGPEAFQTEMERHDRSQIRVASVDDSSEHVCNQILRLAQAHAACRRPSDVFIDDVTDVLREFAVDFDELMRWHQAAGNISRGCLTRGGTPRHELAPRLPHGVEDNMELAELLDRLVQMSKAKSPAWIAWRNVKRYLQETVSRPVPGKTGPQNRTRSEVRFRTPEAARAYMRFLRDLGLPDGRTLILHLSKKGSSETETARDRNWWGKALDCSSARVRPLGSAASRATGQYGWAAIAVQGAGFSSARSRRKAGPASATRQSSRAFHCALHLFAIWGEMHRLQRRDVPLSYPVSESGSRPHETFLF